MHRCLKSYSMIKTILEPGPSGNTLITIAIGDTYKRQWEKYARENWINYCIKNQLGLFLVDDNMIDEKHPYWKKATWQKMLLGVRVRELNKDVKNVCYIDSDFLINQNAPNVFSHANEDCVNLVSLFKNLPYDNEFVKRRVSFLRNKYYSNDYPLDSALFMNIQDLCEYHNTPLLDDFCCAGFFVFNVAKHSDQLSELFYKYKKNIKSITNGGDQFHFNYEIQSVFPINWLPYKFQAIWLYEMASHYPFLYYKENQKNKDLIRAAVLTTLENNYFLHFAGSWFESDMWLIDELFEYKKSEKEDFDNYLTRKIIGLPKGTIKPN